MTGKTYNIDIENSFIHLLVIKVLKKYYNYNGQFQINDGIKQIVHGIYYTINIHLYQNNTQVILRFLHKAWDDADNEFTLIANN